MGSAVTLEHSGDDGIPAVNMEFNHVLPGEALWGVESHHHSPVEHLPRSRVIQVPQFYRLVLRAASRLSSEFPQGLSSIARLSRMRQGPTGAKRDPHREGSRARDPDDRKGRLSPSCGECVDGSPGFSHHSNIPDLTGMLGFTRMAMVTVVTVNRTNCENGKRSAWQAMFGQHPPSREQRDHN